MARKIELTVKLFGEGRKLSAYVRSVLGVSAGLLTQMKKREEAILRNGIPVKTNEILTEGDKITLEAPSLFSERQAESNIAPIPHPAVFIAAEDEDFTILYKPAGMPVHPSRAHVYDTLANAFAALYPDYVFHPITRLDQDTSGLVLAATNLFSANIDRKQVTRLYLGLTDQPVPFFRRRFDGAIEREAPYSHKRAVRPDGKAAVTHCFRLATQNGLTLLAFRLETGRTHQIRVHCADAGLPLCGDVLYGGAPQFGRQALHCAKVLLRNPITGKTLFAKSDLPPDMAALWAEDLEKEGDV